MKPLPIVPPAISMETQILDAPQNFWKKVKCNKVNIDKAIACWSELAGAKNYLSFHLIRAAEYKFDFPVVSNIYNHLEVSQTARISNTIMM